MVKPTAESRTCHARRQSILIPPHPMADEAAADAYPARNNVTRKPGRPGNRRRAPGSASGDEQAQVTAAEPSSRLRRQVRAMLDAMESYVPRAQRDNARAAASGCIGIEPRFPGHAGPLIMRDAPCPRR